MINVYDVLYCHSKWAGRSGGIAFNLDIAKWTKLPIMEFVQNPNNKGQIIAASIIRNEPRTRQQTMQINFPVKLLFA